MFKSVKFVRWLSPNNRSLYSFLNGWCIPPNGLRGLQLDIRLWYFTVVDMPRTVTFGVLLHCESDVLEFTKSIYFVVNTLVYVLK